MPTRRVVAPWMILAVMNALRRKWLICSTVGWVHDPTPAPPQQIYHVPNAVVADDPVDLCRNDHGQAARDSAHNAAGYRKRFERQLRAVCFAHFDTRHVFIHGHKREQLFSHRNIFMCLVRQHIAEPSQRRDYEKKSAEPDKPNTGD